MANTYLQISEGLTLKELNQLVGSGNVNDILNVNGLTRSRDIYDQYKSKCDSVISSSSNVSWKRKSEILNNFSTDSDVFEYAAIQNEDGWKVLSNLMSFEDALCIPETVELVRYDDVLGNGVAVGKSTYDNVMTSLAEYQIIPSNLFNDFSTIRPATYTNTSVQSMGSSFAQWFNIPWGDITFYSSLSGSSVDIPVYPEQISDGRSATYDTMPDTLYQYEPWYTYSSSGPRELSLEFHMHRQMWTGNETDGKANELIRFIQSNVYPDYSGSSVNTSTCTLYIKGYALITGIVTSCSVDWSGPIGRDGYYLDFTMTVGMIETSSQALSHSVAASLPLIG